MGASGPRADLQETSASKGVRRPEPNQGILKLRRFTSVIPPRSDSLLLFPLLFRNKRDGSALLSRSDRALKAISSASHSHIQRDPNYLNADNYLKLSLHVHVRHRAFTRPYSFRVARFYLPPTFTLETSIFCSKESAVLAGFTEPGVHRPLASYPRIYI